MRLSHHNGGVQDVAAYGGVCSSSDARATAAGLAMLAYGGNAVDAAVATAFALAVHEPAMSHLGGQGVALVHLAEQGETHALDFYACAPGAARPDMYRWVESPTQGDYRFTTEGDANTTGARSVAIPGSVCGWVTAHRRWGRLPLAAVVAPAARDARAGTVLTPRMAAFVAEARDRIARFPETARTFLHPDGSPRRAGEVVRQPELGGTLELIADTGYEDFYDGPIAERILAYVRDGGGVLDRTDLARYPGELMWSRPPDTVEFMGLTVASASPSASALSLNLLAILAGLDFTGLDPLGAEQLHLSIEAMKLAFAERRLHVGDHTHVNVPLAGLTSAAYAASRRALIDPACARFPGPGDPWAYQDTGPDPARVTATRPTTPARSGGTTHHCHVDRWGNVVSMSQSLGDAFGSAMTVPGTGIVLNNAMKLFDPRPDRVLAGIAPYRRPLTPAPLLGLVDGTCVLALGSPSGTRLVNATAQVLVNLLAHGMSLQQAVELPRVHWSGDELEVEADVPEPALRRLAQLGHEPVVRSARSPSFGAVQAVGRDPGSGLCHGAADPRRQGGVAGLTLSEFRR